MTIKNISESSKFTKKYKKLDKALKKKAIKLIEKIIKNPTTGKPMRYARKGTRELYLKPFRLSYAYDYKKQEIILLDLYHKKKQ